MFVGSGAFPDLKQTNESCLSASHLSSRGPPFFPHSVSDLFADGTCVTGALQASRLVARLPFIVGWSSYCCYLLCVYATLT